MRTGRHRDAVRECCGQDWSHSILRGPVLGKQSKGSPRKVGLREAVNTTISGTCENTKAQRDEVMRTVQDEKEEFNKQVESLKSARLR